MDEWLARMVMVVQTVGIVSISGLVAYWMRLRHQRKMLADQRELDQLRAWASCSTLSSAEIRHSSAPLAASTATRSSY